MQYLSLCLQSNNTVIFLLFIKPGQLNNHQYTLLNKRTSTFPDYRKRLLFRLSGVDRYSFFKAAQVNISSGDPFYKIRNDYIFLNLQIQILPNI